MRMENIKAPEIILGLANVGDSSVDPMVRFGSPEAVKNLLDTFLCNGYKNLDTARFYPPHAPCTSEPLLGKALKLYKTANTETSFIISTKVLSQVGEHPHSRARIEESILSSLTALQSVPQIDIEYLHMPDHTVPFEETCEAMDKAYQEGKFRRFGICNHSADEVEQLVRICEERNFVKPSVYQGHYNAIVRDAEKKLLPVLRKHGIAFYAYSPAAAGMFSGKPKSTEESGSRWDSSLLIGQIYSQWYLKPGIISAAAEAVEIACKHGLSGHAASLRWVAFHSALNGELGDGIVMGVSNTEQLKQNIDVFGEGPLPQEVADAYSAVFDWQKRHGESLPLSS